MSDNSPSLVVVGGGIIGTMHALEGIRRGYTVTQIEADSEPVGASVRNFGLIWVGGRASGAELDLALRARLRWEEIARSCPGIGFRPAGSLTIARTPEELKVIEVAAEAPDAEDRGFVFVDRVGARLLNGALCGEMLGALMCTRDAIVEPRRALPALRELAQRSGAYTWLCGRRIVDVGPHAVTDHEGTTYRGDLIVCCTGAYSLGLLDEELADAPLRRVHLQMLETHPREHDVTTALADGDSLRYYPAYRDAAFRFLGPQDDLASAWGAQLLLVQRLDGTLTIGDTHRYTEPFPFDLTEDPYLHLLGVATELIGPLPAVARRWPGVYSQVTDDNLLYYRAEIDDGVVVVTGPGGRGMTMSPAIAEETFQ